MSHRPVRAPRDSRDGGRPARRAVARWGWRLFRRQWRQQVVVLALLTLTVAAAIGFATTAFNLAPANGRAEFGTANHFIRLTDLDPDEATDAVEAARGWFDAVDVIGHRAVAVPGAVEPLDYRSQDPDGPYGQPMLDLRSGRYPNGAAEVAVTDAVVDVFELTVGGTFDLDGQSRQVVGVVENPSDLDDEFALLDPAAGSPDSVTILVHGDPDHVAQFRVPGATAVEISSRGDIAEGAAGAVSVLLVATVALAMVGLIAAASFIVIAQRRLRQLGLLAAIGASERNVRFVTIANGVAMGVTAAIGGTALGVAAWFALAPQIASSVGHRIDAANVPWWAIAVAMALAVVASTGAAWWPARTVARVHPVRALSGRPAPASTVHRTSALAAVVAVAGLVALVVAGDTSDRYSVHWVDLALVAGGTLAIVLGVLMLSPLAIRLLGRTAPLLPIGPRLAIRDLARFQGRSSAALAAISLALGVPISTVASASAAEHAPDSGNLSARQLLVRFADVDGPFVPLADDVADRREAVERIADLVDDASVLSFDVAVDPDAEWIEDLNGIPTISLAERSGDGWADITNVYVATPTALEAVGYRGTIGNDVDVLTVERREMSIVGLELDAGEDRSAPERVGRRASLAPRYSSLPGTFMTPERLAERGWVSQPAGLWLIEASSPISLEQREKARDLAIGAGLTTESRDRQSGLARVRTIATIAAVVLALGILAMTVGLIRGESEGDVRTLTATGASSGTRRALTAATAAGLAAAGGVLGAAGAYAALIAGSVRGLGHLPVLHLALIVVGTPLVAAAGGWLLAGREPDHLARRIE